MKFNLHKWSIWRWIIHCILFALVVIMPVSVIISNIHTYIQPYYTDQVYKSLENQFNTSQYRIKNSGIMPDEALFSYVAGAYLHGMDPIMANSEHTPLGKYFLSASIYFFRNDKTIILLFAFLSGLSIWLVSKQVLKDETLALIPLLFISIDKLFINQLVIVPLLDIIQLPFIYLAFSAFIYERPRKRFLLTSICIGIVMATKTVVPGLLIVGSIGIFLLLYGEFQTLFYFCAWLFVSVLVFIASYTRTFMSGYNFFDFLKFQKWIFLYQKSKLIYPFSSFRLLFFNQWQTWWGTFSVVPANDWSLLWPLSTASSIIVAVWISIQKRWRLSKGDPVILLILWIIIYQAFLSLGVISSRFFIPLFPSQYIIMTFLVSRFVTWKKNNRHIIGICVIVLCLSILPRLTHASYVLPYPSFMPGNKMYRIARIVDRIKAPFYFGNLSLYTYHLSLSDKYLVEAKTLFEYKQYLLAADALQRSDAQFAAIPPFLLGAKKEGKDIHMYTSQYLEAAREHERVLTGLMNLLPESFEWSPEKSASTTLSLRDMIAASVTVRQKNVLLVK